MSNIIDLTIDTDSEGSSTSISSSISDVNEPDETQNSDGRPRDEFDGEYWNSRYVF